MTPSSSSTRRGIHVYSLPVSTSVSGNARQEPCRSQFLISIVVRNSPMASNIATSVGDSASFLCGANRIYAGDTLARPFPSASSPLSRRERGTGGEDRLPRYHRQHHVRGVRRVVQQPLVRHNEGRIPLVVTAGVQVAVVLREQRRRHADPQPMPRW